MVDSKQNFDLKSGLTHKPIFVNENDNGLHNINNIDFIYLVEFSRMICYMLVIHY